MVHEPSETMILSPHSLSVLFGEWGLCLSPLGWVAYGAAIRSADGGRAARRRDVCLCRGWDGGGAVPHRPCLQHVWVSSTEKSVTEEQNYHPRLSEPHSFYAATPTPSPEYRKALRSQFRTPFDSSTQRFGLKFRLGLIKSAMLWNRLER